MAAFTALNRFLTKLIDVVVIVMAAVMVVLLFAQVVLRYVFNVTLSWTEELSLGLFTWTVLLGAAQGVRSGFHVRMTLGLDLLRGVPRREAERVISLVTCGLGVYLTFSAWLYVRDTQGTKSAAIGFPIEALYVSSIVCGVLMTLYALEQTITGKTAMTEFDV